MYDDTPHEGLSEKATEVIEGMFSSGSSEQWAVADCLNTIAGNGDEQETDEHLIGCAEEIRDAANYFIEQLKGEPANVSVEGQQPAP